MGKYVSIEIVSYKCIKSFPGFMKGKIYEESTFWNSDSEVFSFIPDNYPEYFKRVIKKKRVIVEDELCNNCVVDLSEIENAAYA